MRAFLWDEIHKIRDEEPDLVEARLPELSTLLGAAKRLWAARTAHDWTEILSERMRRLLSSFTAVAPFNAVPELQKGATRCARPVFNVVRTLCSGWVTDSRFVRDVRPCPWCVAALISFLGGWGCGPGLGACGLWVGETTGAGGHLASFSVGCRGARGPHSYLGGGHRRRALRVPGARAHH